MDEAVQFAVKHALGIAALMAGAQVLDHLVQVEDVAADLAAEVHVQHLAALARELVGELALLELDELALVGSSPERLVACEDGRANVSPIAGTTAAGAGDVERLLASEKDRAEHVMLVDLARNDLGRVCEPGTVQVKSFKHIERYSHVMHIVSRVEGRLTADMTASMRSRLDSP